MKNVYLPELGEGIDKATVACWHASVGDKVTEDDDIVELVTDKATFNVPAGAMGVIKEVRLAEGAEAKVGEILAVIET
jgi:pyruvate/2-oxoglutarate dehydrogenase complex dihydrolipoamide acyltransferase (E2) component